MPAKPTAPPKAQRPRMTPGYGVATTPPNTRRFSWAAAERRLKASRNYWITSTRRGGRAHAIPVWGLWLDGAVYFSSDPASVKGRNVAARPDIVIHLESGDEAVILEGRAECVTDGAELKRFADVYEKKYAFRVDTDNPMYGVYRLHPDVALTWSERAFQASATRWVFPKQRATTTRTATAARKNALTRRRATPKRSSR